ncbi:MAG: AraC family transcriptional regulator [Gammaproteobacteria bacterium]|nr:AraC family transcriptional regulator [Gammaproteobacteria bacterium]
MDLEQKIVPPVYIRRLTEMLLDWGVDPEALLRDSALTLAQLADPSQLLTLQQEITIFERAAELSPRPEWALRVGQLTRMSTLGVYGYAAFTSADLEHALHVLVRYFKLAGIAVGVELREHSNGDLEVRVLDTLHLARVHRSTIEEYFSSFNSVLREVTGKVFVAKQMKFDYPAPPYREVYTEVFACPVHFDCEHSGFVISDRDRELRVSTWDPVTQEACERQCEQIVQRMADAQGFVDEVRKVVLVQACDRRHAEAIAERLHMSTRNLRRKLGQEGTTFQKVLDDVRCELAKNYLSQTQMRLEDISPLVGFSETSNLRRAFKKWTGHTPSAYRQMAIS